MKPLVVLILAAAGLRGQTISNYDTAPQRGTQPNSVYNASDVDTVGLRSGNLGVRIPLATLPSGPGGSSAGISLMYNSQIYDETGTGNDVPNSISFFPRGLRTSTTGGGWTYGYNYAFLEEQRPLLGTVADCGAPDHEHQFKHSLIFPDGSRHLLRMNVNNSPPLLSGDHNYASLDDYNLYDVNGYNFTNASLSPPTYGCNLSSMPSRPVLYTDDGTFIRVVTTNQIQFIGSISVVSGASAPSTNVTLSATNVPNGWTVAIVPGQITVAGGNTRTTNVTLTPPPNAAAGSYSFTFTGSSSGGTVTATLTVNPWTLGVVSSGTSGTAAAGGFSINPSVTGISSVGWTAYFPDGTTVSGVGAQTNSITDRNQNTISVLGYFDPTQAGSGPEIILSDQANRRVHMVHQLGSGTLVASDIVTREYCNSGVLCSAADPAWQVNQTWQVDWSSYAAQTPILYACDLNNGRCNFTPRSTSISQVTLPSALNGEAPRSYTFRYNNEQGLTNGWGEMYSMLTPGGYLTTYSYQFEGATNNQRGVGSGVPLTWNPVLKKVGSNGDGSNAEKWVYTPCIVLPCSASVVTPDGGTTTTAYSSVDGLALQVQQPNLDKVVRVYWYNRPPNSIPPALEQDKQVGNPFIKTEYRYIQKAGAQLLASIVDYTYDKNNNVTAMDEFDCLAASCGTPNTSAPPTGLTATRHSEFSYGTSTSAADSGSEPNASQADAYWSLSAPTLLNAKLTAKVTGSGVTKYSEFQYDHARSTGKLTAKVDWDSTQGGLSAPLSGGNSVQVSATYDANGNMLTRLDALGTRTKFDYGSGSCMNSYPTAVTISDNVAADTLKTSLGWDCTSGLRVSTTDPNLVTTSASFDPFGRLLMLVEGAGADVRTTTMSYSDINRTATTVAPLDGSRTLTSVATFDVRGRVVLSTATSASCGSGLTQTTVEHRYLTPGSTDTNNFGFSYELVSNPYCTTGDPTMGWTRTKRDPNGRVVEVAHFSGAAPPTPWGSFPGPSADSLTTTTYAGDSVRADTSYHNSPATRARMSKVDGLGRMTGVIEDPDALAFSTGYTYDLRDALASVTQTRIAAGVGNSTQTRSFTYDSLGRLNTAFNVESGTTTYGYDKNGNVASVHLANGVTRAYQYNSRNQILSKSYALANTPAVNYCYDGKVLTNGACATQIPAIPKAAGRLTSVSSSAATTNYTSFDSLGRILGSEQWVDGVQYPFTYSYLKGGQLSSETYPSQRQLTYDYNAAGQPKSVVNGATAGACGTATCYASNLTYAPHGAMAGGLFGPLTQSYGYNGLLQTTSITAVKGGTTLWSLTNNYDSPYNDGNIVSQNVNAAGAGGLNVSTQYGYDALNRLSSMSDGFTNQGYGHDSVGNHWVSSGLVLSSLTPVSASNFDGSTNRLVAGSTLQYDGIANTCPGSVTLMGSVALEYDAECRQVKATLGASVTQYVYDGDGRRVKKQTGSAAGTVFVYDAFGELAAEYNGPSIPGATEYLVTDHLGSTRMTVDATGSAITLHDYLPFGEELGAGVAGRNALYGGNELAQKFTGKDRDTETVSSVSQGLDYFGARYFTGAQGQFTSPDPYNIITRAEDREHFNTYLSQPANWNAYVYTWNNPLRYTDPTGETVYVVAYTTGNESGDEEFKRVAQTRANEIRNSKGFDSRKDTVLVQGIKSFDDLKSLVKQANGLEKTFGKVGELSIVSHSGQDGPNFNYGHNRPGGPHYSNEQNPYGIAGLTVNWDSSARACFLGCRSADRYSDGGFAQSFADRQGVPAYGFPDTSGFSSSSSGRSYWYVFGLGGQNLYMTNRDGRPPVRRDPTKAK